MIGTSVLKKLIPLILLFSICNLCLSQIQTKKAFDPSFSLPNSCGITVNAGPDITICAGVGKTLNGSVTNSTDFSWEPPDGLSSTTILRPTANPSMTTTYTLTARAMSSNLISNGNFETGTINPATSQYTQYTVLNNFITSTGGYMVMSVPQIASAFGCNPNIGAFTMAITPTGSGSNIWCQTLAVNPNTDYKIEYKVFGILYIFGSPPTIGLKVNGTLIGSIDAISGLCLEATASFTWNSGASTSATFCLANYGGQGPASMCAIDDITIKECCVEKDEVKVTVYDLVAEAAPVPDINCLNRPITIDASASSQGPGISYNWTTLNGRIVSGEKTLMPVVDTPGTYILKITGLYGCEKELRVQVNGSVKKPDISIKSTDLDCQNPTGTLEASSKSSSPQFEWLGPGGFFSTRARILNLKEPGEYIVKVTDTYGCESTAKIDLKDLRMDLEAEILGDSISCSKDSAVLKAISIARLPIYKWTGPSFSKDSTDNVVVRDSGWYYLSTVDSAGCKELDSFYVKKIFSSIPIKITSDTISCANPAASIVLQVDTSSTVLWSGPNGFSSTSLNPKVTDKGWYYVHITSKDGCNATDSVFVEKSTDVPDIFLSGLDTITCDKKMVTINGGSNSMGSQIEWITPTGIIKDVNTIQAIDSGVFILKVTGANGCVITKDVQIYKDVNPPIIQSASDTLTCTKDSLYINASASNAILFSWIGPNGFLSDKLSPLVNQKGNYTLTATAQNGCSTSSEITIEEDKIPPGVSISSDTINCSQTSVQAMVVVDSLVKNFSWSGPNNFSSNQKNPIFISGGTYSLTIIAQNGCSTTELITILEDTQKPIATLEADTIECKTQASVRALNISPNVNFQWRGPNGFTSILSNPVISQSGYYVFSATGNNGCTFMDSVFVFQKDKLPDISTKDDTLSCIRLSLNLFGNSTTQGVRYEWTGPNGFFSTQQNPSIQDSGIYILKVIDPNGCEAIRQVQIIKISELPVISIQKTGTVISCKDSTIQVILTANQKSKNIIWQGPSGFMSNRDSLVINQAGEYKILFINEYGCEARDSFIIQNLKNNPDFTVSDDSITCIRTKINLQLTTNNPSLTFSWTGPNNFSSTLQNPMITEGGTYLVTASDTAGCQLTKTVFVKADTTKPDLSISADTLTCLRNSVPVKASSSLQGFTMRWTGPNGFTYTLPQFATMIPGRYFCTITNPRSGCSTTTFVDVLEDTSRIRNAAVQIQHASCNQNTGKLFISQIQGGKSPYRYSIDNGQSFIPDLSALDLTPGNYSIIIEDDNGCRFSTSATIRQNTSIDISLAPSIILKQGQSSQLNIIFHTDPNNVATIIWSPANQLSCSDCPDPILTATQDDRILVTVIDKDGCVDTASIQVILQKINNYYVPNVFSPNGDNINDYFYPAGLSSEARVTILSIYDRWGNLVFSKNNFSPGIEREGWDGTSSSNQKVNPGVYIYQVEITDQGINYKFSGDITLIR